jgi:hypothetical protein
LKRFVPDLAAFAVYFGVACVITFPLITQLDARLIGHPFGDATEYAAHVWWIKHALQTGQNPFFQPLLLYPQGLSAAWLWSAPLQSFPAWLFAFVMSVPAAFNLSALLTLALNGWSMFRLARFLLSQPHPLAPSLGGEGEGVVGTRHERAAKGQIPTPPPAPPRIQGGETDFPLFHASGERKSGGEVDSVLSPQPSVLLSAFLAGLTFMLYPTFQGQLAAAHTGLLVLWGVPLLLLALLRLRDGRRFIGIGAALFAVSLWGNLLLLFYLLAPLLGVYALMLLRRRDWSLLGRTLLTLILGGLLALPFLLPTLREATGGASEPGAVRYSAALLGIVAPSFNHPLFSGLEYPRRVLGIDPFEGAAYLGVITAALAAVALIKRRESRWWLIVALSAWVLSLGSLLKLDDAPLTVQVGGYATAIPLPAALLPYIPVLNIARTPGRFNFAVGFAAAILAGYGSAILTRWLKPPRLRVIALLGLAVLIAFEYQFFWPLPTTDAVIPDPIRALAERDDVRALFDVPFQHPLVDKEGLYLQTGHQQALIGGHITRQTPLDPAAGWLLQTFDPALLDAAGADLVILHREWDDAELEATVYARLGAPLYEDARFAVFAVAPYTGDPPGFIWISRVDAEVSDRAEVYLYAPQPGTVTLTGRISADGRRARLLLDGTPLVTWTVSGAQGWNVPIDLTGAGYHTLTLAVDPACPPPNAEALVCRPLHVEQLELRNYRPLRQS